MKSMYVSLARFVVDFNPEVRVVSIGMQCSEFGKPGNTGECQGQGIVRGRTLLPEKLGLLDFEKSLRVPGGRSVT